MKNPLSLLPTRRTRIMALVAAGLFVLLSVVVVVGAVMRNDTAGQPATTSGEQAAPEAAGGTGGSAQPNAATGQPQTPGTPVTPGSSKTAQPGTSASGGTTGSTGTGTGSGTTGGGSSGGGSSGGGSTPTQSCPAYPAFPDAACTGVPGGTVLGAYSGPCTITANNTIIDSKTINCGLTIQATNVVIKNSRVNGVVATPNGSLAYSFTITDSEVIAPQATGIEQTGIGEANFTALRVEVTGGNRSVYCRKNCTVQDSWVHGQNIADSPRIHASGIRQSQGATIIHNRIHCSAEDTSSGGGCSANLTGYGDFEPVQSNSIEKNLFVATPSGACAYGGSSGDDGSKPYGHLAQNIIFKDNIFQRGTGGKCGFYFPITDFDDTRPGNIWSNNKWDDGSVLPPAN